MPPAGQTFLGRLAGEARELLALAREVSFPAGAELVRQGQASRGAYFIRSGSAEARVALPGGGMLGVATFAEGDLFGEMALVERGVCTATVAATTGVRGWFIGRDDFRARVASRDPAALQAQREITRLLAGKLRALNGKVREYPAAEDRPSKTFSFGNTAEPGFAWRDFLPMLPFFEGFDDDEIAEVAAIGRAMELRRGDGLFRAGDEANACYLVMRGALEVFVARDRTERRVAIAGPGELVGFMAVIEGAPRANHARVRERCVLLELRAREFLALYNGTTGATVSLHQAIHRSLMRALGRTNTQLTRLISAGKLRHADRQELEKTLHAQIHNAQTTDPHG